MTFEERKKEFQSGLEELCNRCKIDLYCANVVMPNGEVMPLMKMANTVKEEVIQNKDEDTTKK